MFFQYQIHFAQRRNMDDIPEAFFEGSSTNYLR